MQVFYLPSLQPNDSVAYFDAEESKHMVRVLRKKTGDLIYITNGSGGLFKAEIGLATDKNCQVNIVEVELVPKDPYHIHLAVAPTKMNERFEWFLEKATEIGIHEITPIICDHSERKIIKIDRMEKIIHAAVKQSVRAFAPKLNEPVSFDTFLKVTKNDTGNHFIAHCQTGEKSSLWDALPLSDSYTILIGPEGDFSEAEIKRAVAANYQAVSLGNQRLRTETAALVAVHQAVLKNQIV
ncbi:MAG: 16S rRNA (uracil(1498)-N(3))-methyltransferase [Flavobacterium sp. BFFFF2]|nr:MAG: 16S rRNA (uracil(1498)-N(3))-methyltransferase [Flavobacterium sp. BFFFF2]